MSATDCHEVESLHQTCKTAVNVRQLYAKGSCSHLIPELGDSALHMPDKRHEINHQI